MCTNIATSARIVGSAKTASGWVPVEEVVVTYDHATHAWLDHALRIDFAGAATDGESVAVELDLASGRALLGLLRDVIDEAERSP